MAHQIISTSPFLRFANSFLTPWLSGFPHLQASFFSPIRRHADSFFTARFSGSPLLSFAPFLRFADTPIRSLRSVPPLHRFPDSVPFPRSYWVVPGKLLAGCYPGSAIKEEAHNKLKSLVDHGIHHVINLMEPDELNWSGKPFVSYEEQILSIAESRGHMVTFKRMPIKDTWIPSRIEMCQILDEIDQSIVNDKPAYIHCWGGRGRTGTVAGCYLARHGISLGGKALKLLQALRKDTPDADQPSPERAQQCEMVVSWVEGE